MAKRSNRPYYKTDRLAPVAMLEKPAQRGLEPRVEVVGGSPAELALDLRRVDGVATVVARPVLDEGLQPGVVVHAGRLQCGVAGRRQREAADAQFFCPRHGGRHTPRFERPGGIEAFVLNHQPGTPHPRAQVVGG